MIRAMGGGTTWDRLAEHLARKLRGTELYVINRSFEADVHRMFEAWTDPKKLAQWSAPAGSEMDFIEVDITSGGSSFYCIKNAAGAKMHGRVQYLEITKPGHMVYTQQFCDEEGKTARHPFAPTWPETLKTTVSLLTEDSGHTRVTLAWEPVGNVSPEELSTFIHARAGMTQGWTGTFDKLEAYLGIHGDEN